jgi:hypothetical protein
MKTIKTFKSFRDNKWFISYGLGGGFGGANNHEVIDASNEDEANKYAWEKACEDYDNYAGSHGLRDIGEIMEEDGIEDEDEAEQVFSEEREGWLDYSAEPYDPAKHDRLIR